MAARARQVRKHGRIPLTDDLALALRARGPGFALPGNVGGHIDPAYLGKAVSDLLPTGVAMHKLRHRFASRAYAVDGDLLAVQRLLGHAMPTTTQRYVATSTSNMRRLVEAVATP